MQLLCTFALGRSVFTALSTLFWLLSTPQTAGPWGGRPVFVLPLESRRGSGNLGHELKQLHSLFLSRRAAGLRDDDRNMTLVLLGAERGYEDRLGLPSVFSDTVVLGLDGIPRDQCVRRLLAASPGGESPFWERHWLRDACPPSQLVSAVLW